MADTMYQFGILTSGEGVSLFSDGRTFLKGHMIGVGAQFVY